MIELIEANWLLFVIALLIGIAVAWLVFVASRRTRVETDNSDVLDEGNGPAARNQALIDAPPAARVEAEPPAPVAAEPVTAVADTAPPPQPPAASESDDLTRIKGLGPKIVQILSGLGVTRFAQIAAWDDAEIDRIDAQMDRFAGRIRRDNWVEQAKLLADDDTAGYEARFGKL